RYTLDGSDPVTTSTLYTKPIVINATKVLRCRTFPNDKTIYPSHIEFNTYFIGPASKHSVKVVSIAGGSGISNLLNGTQSSPEGTFELFDENGVFKDESTGEYNKHGNDSWAYQQRGVDYITRDQFGNDSEIHNKIFKLTDRKDFQRIILKPAANDNYPASGGGAHIRDAYVHELAQRAHMDLDVRTYEPCILYVNGAYWGVYELREKADDKDYTDYYYNLDEKEIDYMKTWGATWAEYGSLAPWSTLRSYILANDMTIPANFKYVSDRLNLQSLADYFIINIHTVCKDWLNWNTAWWHGQDAKGNAQKWRYSLWDEDATFGHYVNYTGIPNINADADPCDIDKLGSNSDPQMHTDVLSKLFQNKTFHDYYINRYADLNNTYLSCDYMTKLLDELIARIDPEMPRHIARWGGTYNEWKANVKFLKDFINERCVDIETGLVDCYQLKGPYDLTVVVLPQGSPNNVKVNSIIPSSYAFDAKYYGGTDLSFGALPGTGWKFDKWKTKKMTIAPGVLFPDVTSNIAQADTLFAYFIVECTTKVSLSAPVTDYLDCNHKTVQLLSDVQKGGNDYTYSWKDPGGKAIKDSISASLQVSQSGPYIVFVNDKVQGCIVSDTFLVSDQTIYPNVNISTNEIINCSDSAALILTSGSDAGAQFIYEWKGPCLKNPVTDISNQACIAGSYILIITNNQNGCISS
ncbi:MAG TPA: CotH kinase family protein, partial [Saprospiraceae bacterium]|nr:CotH kinase family protein [Saprospiraceae bacterium]